MKVERNDVAVYDGGDEPAAEEAPKSKREERLEHYQNKHKDKGNFDDNLKNGKGEEDVFKVINFDRSCTDFLCVVVFLVFVSCMFAVAFYGLIKGEPTRLFAPYDYKDRFCGVDAEVEEYPYLFITNFQPQISDGWYANQGQWHMIYKRIFYDESVCVKSCPTKNSGTIKCPPDDESQTKCQTAVDYNTVFKGGSLMNVCLPDYDQMPEPAQKNWDYIINGIKENEMFQTLEYLAQSWKAILLSMATSLLLAIIYIYLMSLFAEYVAWGLIALVQIGLILMAVAGFYFYVTQVGEDKSSYGKAGLVAGIVGSLLALIFCFAVYCGFNQLKIAIEIINCSADFLAQTKRLIAIPFMYFICMFLFFLFWLASMISVESMGNIQAYDTNSSHYLPLRKSITWDDRKELGKTVNLMMGFLTFGLIWFTFFLQASNNYVTMVTAATFYFSSTRDTYGSGQIGTGLRWAWVTNFGSIAFGSFIIALIFTIRMLVYYVCKKAEKASGDNGCVKCITCVAQCLLKCLEEIMEYINKAAYAYMSVSGESFCQSALHGLMLQLSNGAQFGFANLLAAMFILLGKVGLTVANCFILYFYITGTAPAIKAGQPGQSGTAVMQTPSPWGPLVIVAFTTFLLVSVFLGMFDESVIALMTCLCADMQVHGGDNKWGPPTLHDVIDTINGLDPDAEDKKYAEEKAKKAKVNDSEANGMN